MLDPPMCPIPGPPIWFMLELPMGSIPGPFIWPIGPPMWPIPGPPIGPMPGPPIWFMGPPIWPIMPPIWPIPGPPIWFMPRPPMWPIPGPPMWPIPGPPMWPIPGPMGPIVDDKICPLDSLVLALDSLLESLSFLLRSLDLFSVSLDREGGGVGGGGFSLTGAHMLNSAIQFCNVLMGTMHSTFLAVVWRRKMSMKAITCVNRTTENCSEQLLQAWWLIMCRYNLLTSHKIGITRTKKAILRGRQTGRQVISLV